MESSPAMMASVLGRGFLVYHFPSSFARMPSRLDSVYLHCFLCRCKKKVLCLYCRAILWPRPVSFYHQLLSTEIICVLRHAFINLIGNSAHKLKKSLPRILATNAVLWWKSWPPLKAISHCFRVKKEKLTHLMSPT